jgi:hypothetical protein
MTPPIAFEPLDQQLREAGLNAPSTDAASNTQAKSAQALKNDFLGSLLSGSALDELQIQPRPLLLGDWFAEGDLGFLFAKRGVGKTWFALLLAAAIASGGRVGPWFAPRTIQVLYVDGEMPLDLMQKRFLAMAGHCTNLHFLQHEHMFAKTEQVLNLTDLAAQKALTELCLELGIKVLVLDNLSCLFRGVAENDADAWEAVLPWLLDLRRRGIAVLFVCHAGRNMQMRGTSRREDAAAWIIRLDNAVETTITSKTDTNFVSTFTKPSRNAPNTPPPLRWSIGTRDGQIAVSYEEAEGTDEVLKWVRNGLSTCTDIADEMGVSKGTVSKLAMKLIEAGKLRKSGRNYALTDDALTDNRSSIPEKALVSRSAPLAHETGNEDH